MKNITNNLRRNKLPVFQKEENNKQKKKNERKT